MRDHENNEKLIIQGKYQIRKNTINPQLLTQLAPVSAGGLAVKHPALVANGHRFEPHFSAHNIVGG